MDRRPPQPLTPAETKARLRLAACRASPSGWLRRYPLGTAAAGFVVSRDPRLAVRVAGMFAPELARRVARRRPR